MNKKGLECVLAGFLAIAVSGFQYAESGESDTNNFYDKHRPVQGGDGKAQIPGNWNEIKQHANDPTNNYRSNGKPALLGNAGQEWQERNMQGNNYPGANYKTHHQDNLNNRGRGHSQRGNSGACGSEYTHMSGSFRDRSNAQRRKNLLGGAGVNACIESTGNLHRVLITTDYIRNDPQRGVGVSKRPQ